MGLRIPWDAAARSAFVAATGAPEFDWDAWLRCAREERVCPLLYGVLRDHGLVPPRVETELSRAYFANLQRNTFLIGELKGFLGRCSTLNSPPILLKGAALALYLYDDVGVRSMSDLDVLVRESDFIPATHLLEDMGYKHTDSPERLRRNPRQLAQVALYKSGTPAVAVELHRSILNYPYDSPAALSQEWFWTTAERRQAGDAACLILGTEAQVIYLASHVFIHHWTDQKLLWLHDIALLIHRQAPGIDWDRIIARAVAADLILPLQSVLPQVADLFRAPVPEHVMDTLRRHVPSRTARRFFLLYAREPSSHPNVSALYFYINFHNLTGWRAKGRYLVETLFPAPRTLSQHYRIRHPVLLPVFYGYRLLRGAGSALRAARDVALRRIGRRSGGVSAVRDEPGTLSISSLEFSSLAADILGLGASLRCCARGASMEPFIRDGDILTVTPAGPTPRVGDIVLYRGAAGNALLHRVIAVRGQPGRLRLTIWGDAAAGPLDEVESERVLGIAVALERGGRCVPLDYGLRRRASLAWTWVLRSRAWMGRRRKGPNRQACLPRSGMNRRSNNGMP